MPHPLANDPSVPECLRHAFARVTCQIVRVYDDASEGVINMIASPELAERERAEHAKRIGNGYDDPEAPNGRKVLVAVEIRAVA